MFCNYCGTAISDDAEFCSNCGKAVVALKDSTENGIKSEASIAEIGGSQANSVSEAPSVAPGELLAAAGAPVQGNQNTFSGISNNGKTKKILLFASAIVVAIILLIVITNMVGEKQKIKELESVIENQKISELDEAAEEQKIGELDEAAEEQKIGELEDAIFNMFYSDTFDEDTVIKLYNEYDSLSASQKRKVSNRDVIIDAYKQVESLIQQRKQAAKSVDDIIARIDYSNILAQANTVVEAAIAFNSLDKKSAEYVTLTDELLSAYAQVRDLYLTITPDNFFDLFTIEYSVGELSNYGGTTVSQDGYKIDWDSFGGTITPNYNSEAHNDYATPVHVYIAPRYPNLTSECSFHIDLHQTYYGIGLVDSDIHEFELQSADIAFDSHEGIGDYLIYVENNDASDSIWNTIGFSFDWSDAVHSMNAFDVSRVEITNVAGSVSYP